MDRLESSDHSVYLGQLAPKSFNDGFVGYPGLPQNFCSLAAGLVQDCSYKMEWLHLRVMQFLRERRRCV